MTLRLRAPVRRRQLLQVAADVFARRGYRGASTAELAAMAGVTEPILYRHFESKRDLFVAVIDEAGERLVASWRSELERLDDPGKRLAALLAAGSGGLEPVGRQVLLAAMIEAQSDPAILAALRRHVDALTTLIDDELARLQEAGAVPPERSPRALSRLLRSAALGDAILAPLARPGPREGSPAAVRTLLRELFEVEPRAVSSAP